MRRPFDRAQGRPARAGNQLFLSGEAAGFASAAEEDVSPDDLSDLSDLSDFSDAAGLPWLAVELESGVPFLA